MQFQQNGNYTHENIKALKHDFIDLLFCLHKSESVPVATSKKAYPLKKDIALAVRLIDNYLEEELQQKDFLCFVEFTLNLYTLLLETVYIPDYRNDNDCRTFITDYQRGLV